MRVDEYEGYAVATDGDLKLTDFYDTGCVVIEVINEFTGITRSVAFWDWHVQYEVASEATKKVIYGVGVDDTDGEVSLGKWFLERFSIVSKGLGDHALDILITMIRLASKYADELDELEELDGDALSALAESFRSRAYNALTFGGRVTAKKVSESEVKIGGYEV